VNTVKIIECPRDAWQSLPQVIPPTMKAAYLRALIAAGFQHIDAVSFVSPAAVPQMADSEEVLDLLALEPGVEIIGIVVNQKGAERAIGTDAVQTLGFPYSVSPTFLARNQKQTQKEAQQTLQAICGLAAGAGMGVVAYISMAFGNPYGDRWSPDEVLAACHMLEDIGIAQISLADTVGIAGPEQVRTLIAAVTGELPDVEVGAHLHARPEQAAAKINAAYQAGCRRLDMALGGLGGCPFAQDALVGNVATETALTELRRVGAALPQLGRLDELLAMSGSIADRFAAH
jgi:hydroxymethylglutaryl-CoA lyase